MPTLLKPKKTDVIVHPLESPDTTAGGLIKSKAHSKKPDQGIIIALGEEAKRDSGLDIGDHIVFNPYSGDHIPIEDGGLFYVFHHAHVIATIVDSDIKLMATDVVKRLIQDRMLEIRQKHVPIDEKLTKILNDVEDSLLDRIDNYTVAEGFQWGF